MLLKIALNRNETNVTTIEDKKNIGVNSTVKTVRNVYKTIWKLKYL